MAPEPRRNDEAVISLTTKVLIAGVGALIPLAANLYVVDATALAQRFTMLTLIVYLIKAVVMFLTGCLLGEVDPIVWTKNRASLDGGAG